jgi:hypothetical protein
MVISSGHDLDQLILHRLNLAGMDLDPMISQRARGGRHSVRSRTDQSGTDQRADQSRADQSRIGRKSGETGLIRTGTATARLAHVVVVLDQTAYEAALNSEFLPTFGRFTVKDSQTALPGTPPGAALVGRNTLVELFNAGAAPTPGMTGGMVMSFCQPGSQRIARDGLRDAGLQFSHELARRQLDEQGMFPCHHLIRPDLGPDNPFLLMVTEVTPEYYAHIGAAPGQDGELTRSGYLDARLGYGPRPHHRMGDVTEVVYQLRSDRAERFAAVLGALHRPDSDFTVTIQTGEPEGVLAVTMTVSPGPDIVERFGDTSVLTVRGDIARWRFTPRRRK